MELKQIVKKLENITSHIEDQTDPKLKEQVNSLWTELYSFEKRNRIKDISRFLNTFPGEKGVDLYERICNLEEANIFYIDQQPNFDKIAKPERLPRYDYNQIKQILDYVTFRVRKMLDMKVGNINTHSMRGACIIASECAIELLHEFKVDAYEIRSEISFNSYIPHSLVLVEFNDGLQSYIMDLTFRQFCLISCCNPNRKYHFAYPEIFPGYFINSTVAKTLLKDGYIPLTGENAKTYIESFREYKTDYKEEEYIKCIRMGKKLN